MATTITAVEPWAPRRRRAEALLAKHPQAAELLRLYLALCEVWEPAWTAARRERPQPSDLGAHIVERVLPGVIEATLVAAPEELKRMAVSRYHEGDPAAMVNAWLLGDQLPAVDAYLARAAAAPVLEALPPEGAGTDDRRHCPGCGGLPQLAFFESTGDPLLTAPRQLLCSRCSRAWTYPRMVCAACASTDSSSQPIFADVEHFPNLRVDACEQCRRYLVTVELTKDAASVPCVDELAALPLDLYARERGYAKITANLMGI